MKTDTPKCPRCDIDKIRCIDKLERDNSALRGWIRSEGERTDTCTYNILNEICSTCKCHRANPKKQ